MYDEFFGILYVFIKVAPQGLLESLMVYANCLSKH